MYLYIYIILEAILLTLLYTMTNEYQIYSYEAHFLLRSLPPQAMGDSQGDQGLQIQFLCKGAPSGNLECAAAALDQSNSLAVRRVKLQVLATLSTALGRTSGTDPDGKLRHVDPGWSETLQAQIHALAESEDKEPSSFASTAFFRFWLGAWGRGARLCDGALAGLLAAQRRPSGRCSSKSSRGRRRCCSKGHGDDCG